MFVDELELTVRGGHGGNGVVSFRREKYVPMGGPDGGDGGDGGSVVFWADPSKHSFLDLKNRRLLKADAGVNGAGGNRHGARGGDLLVPVPPGTVVRDQQGQLIADLTKPGEKAVVARGGKGGKGNARFTGSRHRAPRLAEKGLSGEEKIISLELKLIAQVGLVGFPNAGKSTLLGRISAAKPKVASYPFTTVTPNLGVVRAGEEGTFVVADIPGLIEGASEGAGLGHRFLRHVERNLLLLFLIDVSPQAHPGPADAYLHLKQELNLYSEKLGSYPKIVAGSKLDLPGSEEGLEQLQRTLQEEGEGVPLHGISAVSGKGVDELVYALYGRVQELAAAAEEESDQEIAPAPAVEPEKPTRVEKKEGIYVVTGDRILRAAARTDFESDDALARFQKYCRRLGLEKLLKKAGIEEGDTVRIGDQEFDYYEDD